MRKPSFILGLSLLCGLLYSGQSLAGLPLFFGERDAIHKLADVELKGNDGEQLYLGYMTQSYFAFAGIYIKDAGYVFGVVGDDTTYYEFPKGDELKGMQEAGVLPKPLPAYEIDPIDYLLGYSLWILLAGALIWFLIKRKKSAASEAQPADQ